MIKSLFTPPPPPLSDRFTRNCPSRGLNLFLPAFIAAALLAACAPLLDEAGRGNLRIVLGGGARALSPQTIAGFSYKLDFSGPGGESFSRALEPGTRAITLNLALGNWTIGVQAFNGAGLLYGKGEMTVLVGPGNNEAPVSMVFSPVWQVASWGNDSNPGSEAAPFATMDAALSAVQAAYAAPDWPGKGTANATPAHIVVSGTITAGTGGLGGMVEIRGTLSLYDSYPPIVLEGTGTLDAGLSLQRVLYIYTTDVTLEGNLTLTRGDATGGSGGGVVVENGTFTMNGGTIKSNSSVWGGGMTVRSGGIFTMTGGTISNNSATVSGGGVYADSGGTFTMTGGTISGNIATYATGGGGEVYVSSGNFTKNGGTIYGDKKEDAVTLEDPNLRNTGLSDHAVHVLIGALKRNSTAGPSVYLNSGYTGPIPGGGWE